MFATASPLSAIEAFSPIPHMSSLHLHSNLGEVSQAGPTPTQGHRADRKPTFWFWVLCVLAALIQGLLLTVHSQTAAPPQ